jgi:hypothetical protein
MVETDILPIRLESQFLLPQSGRTIQEVVSRMGALQAQDYDMIKWAIGCRLPGSTEAQVETALDCGEILRTHVLRPTWHVVSAQDIHWMLDLTASRIRNKMKTRDAQLGLTASIIQKSKAILVKALEGGLQKTKEELDALWNQASIPTTEYRDAHLLMHAELDGLVCNGSSIGKSRSYALLSERAPIIQHLSKEEALAKLATNYFTSRCPATMEDFYWWSGLTVGDVRLAIDSIKSEFNSEKIGNQTYIISNNLSCTSFSTNLVHPLPAFDEFIIAYKDRSATLIPEQFQKIVSNNGVFRPALLHNGKVIGVWKRSKKKDKLLVEIILFDERNQNIDAKIQEAFAAYGRFLGTIVDIYYSKGL